MNKGSTQTDEAKIKISISKKGSIPWNKGIKTGLVSEKQKEIASKNWLGDKNPSCKRDMRGKNHPKWKGGTNRTIDKYRGLKQWKEWREFIFKRDDYRCIDCGEKGCYIEPHHIIPLREDESKVFDKDNGITLCRKCHMKTFGKEPELVNIYKSLISQN